MCCWSCGQKRRISFLGRQQIMETTWTTAAKGTGLLYVCCVSQLSITLTEYLWKSTWKEEWCILSHSFRYFSPWPLGPFAFVLVVRQHVMGEVYGEGGLFTSWWPRREQWQGGSGGMLLKNISAAPQAEDQTFSKQAFKIQATMPGTFSKHNIYSFHLYFLPIVCWHIKSSNLSHFGSCNY